MVTQGQTQVTTGPGGPCKGLGPRVGYKCQKKLHHRGVGGRAGGGSPQKWHWNPQEPPLFSFFPGHVLPEPLSGSPMADLTLLGPAAQPI